MSKRDTIIFWLLAALVLLLFIVSVKSILLPFVVALVAAYFLDPAADKLEEAGFSRTWATVMITVSFFFALAGIFMALGPTLYEQLHAFLQQVPEYVAYANKHIIPALADLISSVEPNALESAREAVNSASGSVLSVAGKVLSNVWQSGLALVNILSLIFITPIVTFYILRDWDRIVAKVDSLLPPKHAFVIRQQVLEIDKTLSGYIRGQTNVCLLLGVFYAVGLGLVGLDFALFIGMATGILSFIPYVGMLFGFVTGMVIAFFQYGGDIVQLAMVAGVFVLGQLIEGNFITPKLVGDKVGLHPVWIIFGMLAGAALFGFTGILLAVPVTAVIGVLVRFAMSRYIESGLFQERG